MSRKVKKEYGYVLLPNRPKEIEGALLYKFERKRVRILARTEGYAMVKRLREMPIVISERELIGEKKEL